jgi:hypothetical protein
MAMGCKPCLGGGAMVGQMHEFGFVALAVEDAYRTGLRRFDHQECVG